jgi:hypothetical protein
MTSDHRHGATSLIKMNNKDNATIHHQVRLIQEQLESGDDLQAIATILSEKPRDIKETELRKLLQLFVHPWSWRLADTDEIDT